MTVIKHIFEFTSISVLKTKTYIHRKSLLYMFDDYVSILFIDYCYKQI